MQDLFFEARTLKPYVNSVPQADLVVGHTYFQSGFIDEDMVVPELSAVVFLGKDLNPRLPGIYFQDARSYFAGTRPEAEIWASALDDGGELPDGYSWISDDLQLHWKPAGSASRVLDFESLLDSLLMCSLRRRTWDGVVRPIDARDEDAET